MKAPTLEEQLLAASKELRAKHSDLQARRNAVGAQLSALVNAPPNRADLRCFFERFLTDLLRREPRAPLHELRTSLERFAKNPRPQEVDAFLEGLHTSTRGGHGEFADALFLALLEPLLFEQAERLANELPWPDTAGLPAEARAKQAGLLEGQMAKLQDEIEDLQAAAKRLHLSLSPDVEPAKTA
ncbi:MAG: hypothetical protein H6969_12095 [Gammaproteobacteria bacterium]|nr:hypothetical protein [Candidatus Competibacteraceae bacterium]MCP5421212.1 hypothetical protein [Gammaproteobacteria bacterium]